MSKPEYVTRKIKEGIAPPFVARLPVDLVACARCGSYVWERHRDDAATSITVRTCGYPATPVTDAEKQWRDIETKWHESNGPVVLQHGTAQPFIADQIHDAAYTEDDDQ